jgi:hypothetical protein
MIKEELMSKFIRFFAARWGIISVGASIGVFVPLLQRWGNPGNMGICVACFELSVESLNVRKNSFPKRQ